MAKVFFAQEVMTWFNTRSDLGRVVVPSSSKMAPLKLRTTDCPMYFCCGRAFLSEESYHNHKDSVTTHGKPIDFSKIRTALNSRSSLAFWRSTKTKAAKQYTESDEEGNQNQDDSYLAANVNGHDGSIKSNEKVARHKMYRTCEICKLSMPKTNVLRHKRICHNPDNEYLCRHCTCRFATAYGRMSHEVKLHRNIYQATNKLKTLKKQLIKPLVNPVRPKIIGLGYIRLNKKEFRCTVCNKIIRGNQTIKDHMNIHKGIKPYKCCICGFAFTHKTNLIRHSENAHSDGQFPCENNCGCVYNSAQKVLYHRRFCVLLGNGHGPGKKKFMASSIEFSANDEDQTENGHWLSPPSMPLLQQEIKPRSRAKTQISGWEDEMIRCKIAPGLFECPTCHKTVSCSGNFRDHLNSHAGIKPHKCNQCFLTFTFKCNIKRHVNTCHVENGLECKNNCGCMMSSESALQSHMQSCIKKIKEMQKNQQPIPRKPQTQQQIAEPFKFKTEPMSPAKSPHRGQYQEKELQQILSNTSTVSHEFKCKICLKTVSCARNLRNHMLIHLNMKPCKCGLCGLSFRSQDQIKKHMTRSHVPNGAFRCSECSCQFENSHGLMFHVGRFHTKKNLIQKSQIRKPIPQIIRKPTSPLKKPLKLKFKFLPPMPRLIPKPREQLKPQANPASKIVNTEIDYEYEGQEGEDPLAGQPNEGNSKFRCNICGSVFKSVHNLRYHKYIHTGEKPYKCTLCGYNFRRKGTLHDHQKSSHMSGNYFCTKCTCRFESEMGLKRHEGLFHSEKTTMRKTRNDPSLQGPKTIGVNGRRTSTNSNDAASPAGPKVSNSGSELVKQLQTHQKFNNQPILDKAQSPAIVEGVTGSKVKIKIEPGTANLVSTDQKKFWCGHCGLKFYTLYELSDHQKLHTKEESVDFEDESMLEYANNVFENETIGLSPTPTLTNKATLRVNKIPKNCPICSCIIHGSTHYKKHMKGCHSEDSTFFCTKCPCKFQKSGILNKHYTLFHKDEHDISGPYSYKKKNTVGGGLNRNTNVKTEQNRLARREISFIKPLISKPTATALVSEKVYNNPGDSMNFAKQTQELTNHTITHGTVMKYECKVCHATFKTNATLYAHKKKSHGNGRFKCKLCPCRFKAFKGLTVHTYVYHKGGREIQNQIHEKKKSITLDPTTLVSRSISSSIGARQIDQEIETSKASNIVNSDQNINKSIPDKVSSSVDTLGSSNRPAAVRLLSSSTGTKFSPKNRPMKCKTCGKKCLGPEIFRIHMDSHQNDKESINVSLNGNQSGANTNVVVDENVNASLERLKDLPNKMPELDKELINKELVNEEESNSPPGLNNGEEEQEEPVINYEEESMEYNENDSLEQEESMEEENGYMINYEMEEYDNGDENGSQDVVLLGSDDFDLDSYDCQGCGLSFTSRAIFLRHIKSTGKGPFNCPYCCAVERTLESLRAHSELYHEELLGEEEEAEEAAGQFNLLY